MKTRLNVYAAAACAVLALYCWDAAPEGLNTLIGLGKSMDAIQRDLKDEDSSYEKVSKAIVDGGIEEGLSEEAAERRFGEPVVKIEDENGGARWIYKPSDKSFFDGPKAYLFFDEKGNLARTRQVAGKSGEDGR